MSEKYCYGYSEEYFVEGGFDSREEALEAAKENDTDHEGSIYTGIEAHWDQFIKSGIRFAAHGLESFNETMWEETGIEDPAIEKTKENVEELGKIIYDWLKTKKISQYKVTNIEYHLV